MGFLNSLFKTAVHTAKDAVRDEVRTSTRRAVNGAFDKAEEGVKNTFKQAPAPANPSTVATENIAATENTAAVAAENTATTDDSEKQELNLDMSRMMELSAVVGRMTGQVTKEQAAEMREAAKILEDPEQLNAATNVINEAYGDPFRSTTKDKDEALQNVMKACAKIGSDTNTVRAQQVRRALKKQGIDPDKFNADMTRAANYKEEMENMKI